VVPLDLVRTFMAIYRAGSITAAAESLGLSQPTVTAQLRSLETALGRPLFDRLPRGVAATGAAHELARRAAGPLDALESVFGDLTGTTRHGTVRLGGPAELLAERALPALATLVAAGHQVRVTPGLPEDLLDALARGRLDLAITTTRPRRGGLHVEPLYDEHFALVAAPAWRLPAPATPESLRSIPLVGYAEDAPILRRYWRTVFAARLTRTPDLVVPDLRAVLRAVVAGAGAGVLPTYLTQGPVADGSLCQLVEPEVPPLNTLYLAARPSSLTRPAVAAVRGQLLRQAPAWTT